METHILQNITNMATSNAQQQRELAEDRKQNAEEVTTERKKLLQKINQTTRKNHTNASIGNPNTNSAGVSVPNQEVTN